MEQKRFKDEYGYKYDFSAVIRRGEQVTVHCPRCQGQAFISISKKTVITSFDVLIVTTHISSPNLIHSMHAAYATIANGILISKSMMTERNSIKIQI